MKETSIKWFERGIHCSNKMNSLKKDVKKMTTIFGKLDIQQITGGTVNFGNTLCISPKSAVKDPSGGGSKNQGGLVCTSTGFSVVNYIDPDVRDQESESAGC